MRIKLFALRLIIFFWISTISIFFTSIHSIISNNSLKSLHEIYHFSHFLFVFHLSWIHVMIDNVFRHNWNVITFRVFFWSFFIWNSFYNWWYKNIFKFLRLIFFYLKFILWLIISFFTTLTLKAISIFFWQITNFYDWKQFFWKLKKNDRKSYNTIWNN